MPAKAPPGPSKRPARTRQAPTASPRANEERSTSRGGSDRDRAEPERAPKRRRGLSHVGGAVEFQGQDGALRPILERALNVRPDEKRTMAHVHGFHSYPARLHPDTAAELIRDLSANGATVYDPFCGSGTVVIEALLAERRAFGTDVNPLAIELSWLKTLKTDAAFRAAVGEASRQVAESADERRLTKAGPSKAYAHSDRALFPIHVLLELDGIAHAIDRLGNAKQERVLRLVLSSILTKVSYRPGDSTTHFEARRMASGATIRLFLEKTSELVRRLDDFAKQLPSKASAPRLAVSDARKQGPVGAGSADLILTSPPYPGVFDYFDHHRDRLRWLKLSSVRFQADEMGSRRAMARTDPELGLATWRRDFENCLTECRRVLAARGTLVLIVADSVIGGRPFFADRALFELGARTGFDVALSAAQERPYFHSPTARAFERRPRKEHVLVLRKA